MALWAIAYDLDVRGMKDAGMTGSQVTAYYSSVRGCLADHSFERQKQWSIYTSSKDNTLTNAFQACQCLQSLPNVDFIKRLHLFRIEDLNDLLPLVAGHPSDGEDPVLQEIEEVFGEEAVSSSSSAD